MCSSYCNKQYGFTLVEIIIVIAIFGMLAIIATRSYTMYIIKAYNHACLSEVKSYSNNVLYILNDQNDSNNPIAPTLQSCQFITDATGWTLATQQKIIATAKSPSDARIECDIPNGAPCRITP